MTPKRIPRLYNLNNEADYHRFLKDNNDNLVCVKFFAPWCRSCKALEPKFKRVMNEDYSVHVRFAQFNVQDNKEFVKSLGILALPSVRRRASENEERTTEARSETTSIISRFVASLLVCSLCV